MGQEDDWGEDEIKQRRAGPHTSTDCPPTVTEGKAMHIDMHILEGNVPVFQETLFRKCSLETPAESLSLSSCQQTSIHKHLSVYLCSGSTQPLSIPPSHAFAHMLSALEIPISPYLTLKFRLASVSLISFTVGTTSCLGMMT